MEFKFAVQQWVRIIAYELYYPARVIRRIQDGTQNIYDVDYVADGEIKRRECLEDELEARGE